MTEVDVNLDEVLAELDDLSRAKFDAALGRVQIRKLSARVAELENTHHTTEVSE